MFVEDTFTFDYLADQNPIDAKFITLTGLIKLQLKCSEIDFGKSKDYDYELICLVRSKLNDSSIFKLKFLFETDDIKTYIIIIHSDRKNWLHARTIQSVPDLFKDDKEIVLNVVSREGGQLNKVSEKYKNDEDVALVAIYNNTSSMYYASDKLKNNKEFALKIVSYDGCTLQYFSTDIKNNKEIVLVAVDQNGILLQYASDILKNDKEVVLVAIDNNGCAFTSASNELKNDRDFILSAIKQNGNVYKYKYISQQFKRDETFIGALVRKLTHSLPLTYTNKKMLQT